MFPRARAVAAQAEVRAGASHRRAGRVVQWCVLACVTINFASCAIFSEKKQIVLLRRYICTGVWIVLPRHKCIYVGTRKTNYGPRGESRWLLKGLINNWEQFYTNNHTIFVKNALHADVCGFMRTFVILVPNYQKISRL